MSPTRNAPSSGWVSSSPRASPASVTIIRISVVLPAPFGPMIPTMPPGGSLNDRSSYSNRSPYPLVTASPSDHDVTEPRAVGDHDDGLGDLLGPSFVSSCS